MTSVIDKQKIIQESAQQSPCLCFNIRKASRAITQVYDDMFRDLGLRSTQVFMLSRLNAAESLTVLEFAQAMATDRTTITRNLKPLEREGFIYIKSGKDKREREIGITLKGKNFLEKAFVCFEEFQKQLYKYAGKNNIEKLCNDLSKIVEIVQQL